MTDLALFAKTQPSTMLAARLNPSALKKIGKPDWIRLVC